MKTKQVIVLLMLSTLFGCIAVAAPFDSGSTGTNGAMNITSNTTLTLPPEGIFNCTTITVASNATLRFTNNAMNTPVYLLATGDVLIHGTIDVSGESVSGSIPGRGGPGGFDGGHGGSVFAGHHDAGDGLGPGGGKRTDPNPSGKFANVYGNLLCVPLIGGSGGTGVEGTPGNAGAGGGGAILIASNTKIVVGGIVAAQGGISGSQYCQSGGGSGGAIRLVAPLVNGLGLLDARAGGSAGYFCGGPGGLGRIRIDCDDNRAFRTLSMNGVAARGSQMFVFPAVLPKLDIINVAGQPIPQGTNSPVIFELPNGASTNQLVMIQARNFTNDVPIRVVVTPENGPALSFDSTILQASGNPPNANVPIVIPAGSISRINAWTR